MDNYDTLQKPKSTKQIQAESLVNCLHSVYYWKMTFILLSDDTTLSILLLSVFGTKTLSLLILLVETSNGNILKVCSAVIVKFLC